MKEEPNTIEIEFGFTNHTYNSAQDEKQYWLFWVRVYDVNGKQMPWPFEVIPSVKRKHKGRTYKATPIAYNGGQEKVGVDGVSGIWWPTEGA